MLPFSLHQIGKGDGGSSVPPPLNPHGQTLQAFSLYAPEAPIRATDVKKSILPKIRMSYCSKHHLPWFTADI